MPTQSIDLSQSTKLATFNGSAVEQINLNGAGIWTKPASFPAVDSSWTFSWDTTDVASTLGLAISSAPVPTWQSNAVITPNPDTFRLIPLGPNYVHASTQYPTASAWRIPDIGYTNGVNIAPYSAYSSTHWAGFFDNGDSRFYSFLAVTDQGGFYTFLMTEQSCYNGCWLSNKGSVGVNQASKDTTNASIAAVTAQMHLTQNWKFYFRLGG